MYWLAPWIGLSAVAAALGIARAPWRVLLAFAFAVVIGYAILGVTAVGSEAPNDDTHGLGYWYASLGIAGAALAWLGGAWVRSVATVLRSRGTSS